MPVSLEEYRQSLVNVKCAEGLSDVELQRGLDYTYRFANAYYDWWHDRKGSAIDIFGGGYVFDGILEAERKQSFPFPRSFPHKTGEEVYTIPQPYPPTWMEIIREQIWKIPKGNLLQS
ncbi:MAG: hypothetical protein WA021_00945 [Minisyncoccia bacterium]